MIVILTDPDGDAASDEFQATVADSRGATRGRARTSSEILTYADVGDPSFVSRDGTKTFALVRLDEPIEDAVDDAADLAALVDAPAGVETTITGIPLVQHEFNQAIEQDLFQAEIDQPADRDADPARRLRHAGRRGAAAAHRRAGPADRRSRSSACWPASPR